MNAVKSLILMSTALQASHAFSNQPSIVGTASGQPHQHLAAKGLNPSPPPVYSLNKQQTLSQPLYSTPNRLQTRLYANGPIEHGKQPQPGRLGENGKALIAKRCSDLIASCKTLNYAVSSPDGKKTELNYAPFSRSVNPAKFFVMGSRLASSSRALTAAANSGVPAALFFSQPDAQTTQLYAKERAMLQANVKIVDRGSAIWQEQIEKLGAQFGDVVDTLSNMEDFNLYELSPTKVRYIRGFGQAYNVNPKDIT